MKRLISAIVAVMVATTVGVTGTSPMASAFEAKPKVPAGHLVTPDGKVVKMVSSTKAQKAAARTSTATLRKGKAPLPGQVSAQYSCDGVGTKACYLYNTASQASINKNGAQAYVRVGGHQGSLNGGTDYHTLGELAARSSNGSQIIEVGWTVDPNVNFVQPLTNPPVRSYKPRPFVFSWVNGEPRGYNLNGDFDAVAGASVVPGITDLTPGAVVQMKIWHDDVQNFWWISWNEEFIGGFHDSSWDSASPSVNFDRIQWYQSFGEIASTESTPCSDMGLGVLPTNTTDSARFSSTTYINSDWSLDGSSVNLAISSTPNASSPYAGVVGAGSPPSTTNLRSFFYGGPMFTAAGTAVGTKGAC